MTVEEEIRKHAKTYMDYVEWFCRLSPKQADALKHHLIISVDVVLGVVAKTEAERQKQLTDFIEQHAWTTTMVRNIGVDHKKTLWIEVSQLKPFLQRGEAQQP